MAEINKFLRDILVFAEALNLVDEEIILKSSGFTEGHGSLRTNFLALQQMMAEPGSTFDARLPFQLCYRMESKTFCSD